MVITQTTKEANMAVAGAHQSHTHRHRAERRAHAGRHTADTKVDTQSALIRFGRIAYAALILAATVAIIMSAAARIDRPQPHAWISVTVGDSSTLWTIAQEYPVPGLTTAETVALIKESNVLTSAVINPGQPLRVPVQDQPALSLASR